MTLYVPVTNWQSFSLVDATTSEPEQVRIEIPRFSGDNLYFINQGSGNLWFKYGDDEDSIEFAVSGLPAPADDAEGITDVEFHGVPYGATHLIVATHSEGTTNFKIRFVTVER